MTTYCDSSALLPNELWTHVFTFLTSSSDMSAISCTCRQFREIMSSDYFKYLKIILTKFQQPYVSYIQLLNRSVSRPPNYKYCHYVLNKIGTMYPPEILALFYSIDPLPPLDLNLEINHSDERTGYFYVSPDQLPADYARGKKMVGKDMGMKFIQNYESYFLCRRIQFEKRFFVMVIFHVAEDWSHYKWHINVCGRDDTPLPASLASLIGPVSDEKLIQLSELFRYNISFFK